MMSLMRIIFLLASIALGSCSVHNPGVHDNNARIENVDRTLPKRFNGIPMHNCYGKAGQEWRQCLGVDYK